MVSAKILEKRKQICVQKKPNITSENQYGTFKAIGTHAESTSLIFIKLKKVLIS
jgi:hypothetical protein